MNALLSIVESRYFR